MADRGYTLMEVTIVIMLVAILSSMAISATLPAINAGRFEATVAEMKTIETAIAGNPTLIADGRRVSFGYVGDMGGLPDSLEDLVERGTQAVWTFDSSTGVGHGWNGPYLRSGFEGDDGHSYDAWGHPYDYSKVDGRIKSYGADGKPGGTGYAEDITLLLPTATGSITGTIRSAGGEEAEALSVTVYYPEGSLVKSKVADAAGGTFHLPDIPKGLRPIKISWSYAGESHERWLEVQVDRQQVLMPLIEIEVGD